MPPFRVIPVFRATAFEPSQFGSHNINISHIWLTYRLHVIWEFGDISTNYLRLRLVQYFGFGFNFSKEGN